MYRYYKSDSNCKLCLGRGIYNLKQKCGACGTVDTKIRTVTCGCVKPCSKEDELETLRAQIQVPVVLDSIGKVHEMATSDIEVRADEELLTVDEDTELPIYEGELHDVTPE